jgi:hypothetical protein
VLPTRVEPRKHIRGQAADLGIHAARDARGRPAYRAERDNERCHVLILDELIAAKGERKNRLRFQLLPQLVTFVCTSSSAWIASPGPGER